MILYLFQRNLEKWQQNCSCDLKCRRTSASIWRAESIIIKGINILQGPLVAGGVLYRTFLLDKIPQV